MNTQCKHWILHGIFWLILAALSSPVLASWIFNTNPAITLISHSNYQLHIMLFWICLAMGVLVFGVMIYSFIRHRKSPGAEATAFNEHPWLEVLWAFIPFLIVIIVMIPAANALIAKDNMSADIAIKAIES